MAPASFPTIFGQSVDGGGAYTAHVAPASRSAARWPARSSGAAGGGPAHVTVSALVETASGDTAQKLCGVPRSAATVWAAGELPDVHTSMPKSSSALATRRIDSSRRPTGGNGSP